MAFYEILSELMNTNKVTAKQLSETLKIGKNQFKYWKDKGNIPNGDTLIALADYFQCSVDYLLGRAKKQQEEYQIVPIENDESDRNKQRLLRNYDSMNESAQEHIANYSDFMVSNETNLKSDIQNNKMKT